MTEYSLNDVLRAVNSVVEECDGRHSCLQTSMMLTEVLKKAGFTDAYPLTVSVTVFNAAGAKVASEYLEESDVQGCAAEFDATGGFLRSITFEGPVDETGWAGHLVVIVPNYCGTRHGMLDLTIEQLNTPDKGIVLKQLSVEVSNRFLSGTDPFVTMVNGCTLVYRSHPDDRTYEDTNGRMRSEGFFLLVAIAKCRLEFGEDFMSIGSPSNS